MSNCEHYQVLISRMLDKDLSRDEVLAVMEHLDHCAECAAMYEAFNALSDTVADDMAQPPEGFAENVMANIRRQEIRKKNMKTKKQLKTVIAAAACVAVVIAIVGGFSVIKSSRSKNAVYESRVNVDKKSASASSDDVSVATVTGEPTPATTTDENILAPVNTDNSALPPIQWSTTTKSSSATAYIVTPTPAYSTGSSGYTGYTGYTQYQPTPTPNTTPVLVQTPTPAQAPVYSNGISVVPQTEAPVVAVTPTQAPVLAQSAALPTTPTAAPVNAIEYVGNVYNDSDEFVNAFDLTTYDTTHFMSVIRGTTPISEDIGNAIANTSSPSPANGEAWNAPLPIDRFPLRADIFSYMENANLKQLEVRAYDNAVYLVYNNDNGDPVCETAPYGPEQYRALLVTYTLAEPEVSQAELDAQAAAAAKAAEEAEAQRIAEAQAAAAAEAEAQRLAEEQAAAEAQRLAEEQAAAEAQRIAEAQAAAAAEAEAQRLAEEQAAEAEAQRLAEEQAAAEARRLAEEQAAAEAQRLAEEQAALEAKKFDAIETLGPAYNDNGENVTTPIDLTLNDTALLMSILKGDTAIEEEIGTDIASILPDTLPSPEILPEGVERAWDDALPDEKNPVRADVISYMLNNEQKQIEIRIYDDFVYIIYNDDEGFPVCSVASYSQAQYEALMNKLFPGMLPLGAPVEESYNVDNSDSNAQ